MGREAVKWEEAGEAGREGWETLGGSVSREPTVGNTVAVEEERSRVQAAAAEGAGSGAETAASLSSPKTSGAAPGLACTEEF